MISQAANMAKVAAEAGQLRAEVARLKAEVAAHEKRASAEALLIEVMRDPRANFDMKPLDVEDFLIKRAHIANLDPDTARAAVKMASTRSFEVGAAEASNPQSPASSGSKAEDDFINSFLNAG